MSLQFDTTVQNAMLEALQTAIGPSAKIQFFAGLIPASCAAVSVNAVKLVEFQLQAVWAAGSVRGQKFLSNVPLQGIASNTGQASYFCIVDTLGMCHMQGTITGAGLGGDFELDNPNVTQGQTVTIGSWAINAPGF